MKNPGRIAIRVDADTKIGLGHLTRCMTLARQLRRDGFEVQVLGRYRFGGAIGQLTESFPASWLEDTAIGIRRKDVLENGGWDVEATLSIIREHPNGVSWVIVDNYGLDELWEQAIRAAGHRVLAIDDFRNRRHSADILVSDINTPFQRALNHGIEATREFVGPKFALVDPEFAFFDEPRTLATGPWRLLISYGGSDPTDETTKALEAVRLLRSSDETRASIGRVDVVVGHANARTDEVIRFAKEITAVNIHIAPKSLAPFLRGTDLFLTSGGNSMIEALAMRKPCLVTVTGDNQTLMVAQMLERQAIVSLGSYSMVGATDVTNLVAEILAGYERLANRVRARPIFDHLGAARISAAIQSLPMDLSS